MELIHSCRCCLRTPPDKDLTTPYTYLGKTEIYSNMLQECFDIHLILNGNGSCGICEVCVGRLRDASNFKRQVQRCQAELQGTFVKVEPSFKSEVADEAGEAVFNVLHVELIEKPEVNVEDEAGHIFHEDPLFKATAADDLISDKNWTITSETRLKLAARVKARRGKRPKRMKEATLKHNDKNAANELFCCETCGKQFKKKYILVRHIRTHTSREGYPCKICNKTLLTYSDLKRHKLIHTGEKRYKCEECNLQFTQKGNLDRHRRIHTGERPFVCDDCDKQFANKSNLDRHRKLHTGDKPYICEKCSKRFSQKGNLRIHKCVYNDR